MSMLILFYYILLSESDCTGNCWVQMFFSLYGFEEHFLVEVIDYVGQYGSFICTNRNQEFLTSQIDKRTESRNFYPKEKNPQHGVQQCERKHMWQNQWFTSISFHIQHMWAPYKEKHSLQGPREWFRYSFVEGNF